MRTIKELLELLLEEFKANEYRGLCFTAIILLNKNLITVEEMLKLEKYLENNKPQNINPLLNGYWWKDNDPARIQWLVHHININTSPTIDQLTVGSKVNYTNRSIIENGIVKEIPTHTKESVRVVYNCAGVWENYKNYTSALTHLRDLKLGWNENAVNFKS